MYKTLEKAINYEFKDKSFLIHALTHKSYEGRDRKNHINNERMELLGDKILGFTITKLLFEAYPEKNEGFLSKNIAYLTSKSILCKVAENINLKDYIHHKSQYLNDTIISDAIEAVLCSVYLDSNDFSTAFNVIKVLWKDFLQEDNINNYNSSLNVKSQLQEWAQKKGLPIPTYRDIAVEGEHHNPIFTVELEVSGYPKEIAKSNSKKMAQKEVAISFIKKHIS